MTGVVGALVALAVVVALVLVLAVRPHVRRLARSVAVLRADTAAGCDRLRAIRAARPHAPPSLRRRDLLHWGPRTPPPGGDRAVDSVATNHHPCGPAGPHGTTSEAEAMPGGWEWLIIIGVLVLLFGAKRLPEMARSVGQSARVFKGEMKGLKDDEGRTTAQRPRRSRTPVPPRLPSPPRCRRSTPARRQRHDPGTWPAPRRSRPSPSGATPTADPRQ